MIKEAEKLEDEEEYKLAQFAYEFAYDEVPKEILEEVRAKIEGNSTEEEPKDWKPSISLIFHIDQQETPAQR